MIFPFYKNVDSEEETADVAKIFSGLLQPGDIVLLNGDLGAGKTYFVKSVCSHFGITSVSSPTFAIVNEYHNGRRITHFDFYRIKKIEELYDIGFEDYLMNRESITFIEWSDMFPDILPARNYTVEITGGMNNSRKISIIKYE